MGHWIDRAYIEGRLRAINYWMDIQRNDDLSEYDLGVGVRLGSLRRPLRAFEGHSRIKADSEGQ